MMARGLAYSPFVVACLWALFVAPAVAAPRAQRSLVFIDSELPQNDAKVSEQLAALAGRFEELLKWKPGSLQVQGFVSLEAAQPFIDKQRPAFGIVAIHPFAQLHKAKQVELLGYASAMEAKGYRYNFLSRISDNLGALPHQQPNLRMTTVIKDMQWLNVIFDGMLNPKTHFQHVPVASEEEGVKAVVAKKADAALVWAENLPRYNKFLGAAGGLRVSFLSAPFPPLSVVAFKQAAKRDAKAVKSLVKVLPEVCKGTENLDMCGALGFHYMAAGEHQVHPHLIYKYENYK